MNKIPPLLLCLFLFLGMGCSPNNTEMPTPEMPKNKASIEDTSPETQLSELVKKELKLDKQKNNIILNFQFGMTKKEVVRHMQKLEKEKKIVKRKAKSDRNDFVYLLLVPQIGEVDVYFDFYYHEGKLSKVESYPSLPKDKTLEDLLTGCAEVLETKYGMPHVIFPRKDDKSCANYFWIESNRQIELHCNEKAVTFIYSDLKVYQKALMPEKTDAAELEI